MHPNVVSRDLDTARAERDRDTADLDGNTVRDVMRHLRTQRRQLPLVQLM